MNVKKIVSLATAVVLGLALLSFVFPFLSAFGQSLSGFGCMGDAPDDIAVPLIFAFLVGVAAFILAFFNRKKIPPFICAGLCLFAVIMLIVFSSKCADGFGADLTGAGWWISLFMFIFGLGGSVASIIMHKSNANAQQGGYQQQATKVCPWCRQIIPVTMKFCPYCTQPLKRQCPRCGTENNIETRFCVGCGQAFPPVNGNSARQG